MLRRWPILALLILPACAPKAISGPAAFNGPDPSTRMSAIAEAARDKNQAAIPQIIDSLDDADPAVRLLAAATLEKLTGLTHGYDATAPRPQRLEAIAKWKAWLAERRPAANDGPSARGRQAPLLVSSRSRTT